MSERAWNSKAGPGGKSQWRGKSNKWRPGSWHRNNSYQNSRYNSSSQVQATQVQSVVSDCPYRGWTLYFPSEPYVKDSPTVRLIRSYESYFSTACIDIDSVENSGSLLVDFSELHESIGIRDFVEQFKASPEHHILCANLALHQTIYEKRRMDCDGDVSFANRWSSDNVSQPLFVRFYNIEAPVPLRTLKAKLYGKFVSIRGTVVRVSPVRPHVTHLAFQCQSCSSKQVLVLQNGRYTFPSKCTTTACRSRQFNPLRSDNSTCTVDRQIIRIQELLSEAGATENSTADNDLGRIPRSVECELTCDLVDQCVPGDVVTLSGLVSVRQDGQGERNYPGNQDRCLFTLYIQANSIINERGRSNEVNDDKDCEFTVKELYAIQAIHAEKNLFKLLVASMCPGIYGHDNVKIGLLLGLFGGVTKYADEKNRVPIRGDPHVLVVGDPGLGKSQMLQAAARLSPRGVYVCGNTTTAAGLTVTLTRDSSSGQECALEAGALVLADQGCCCIDEFDKMSGQHAALLEAMEQQSISIAKAGIVCSLPARASILAAANPHSGHYNRGRTVAENLKMNSALLSRFDLVFIMLDRPDAELDLRLSEHVMALHGGRNQSSRDTSSTSSSAKQSKEVSGDLIPSVLLRKYIAYARKYVNPDLKPDAAAVLQEFYLELRKQHHTKDSTPITTRQLESLIRLTEARARAELREHATKSDAEEVVALMRASMLDVFANEYGFLDFSRSQQGSGMSGRSAAKRLISLMEVIAERNSSSLFSVSQIHQIVSDHGLVLRDNLLDVLSSLNHQGYLLKAGPKLYRLQTTGF